MNLKPGLFFTTSHELKKVKEQVDEIKVKGQTTQQR